MYSYSLLEDPRAAMARRLPAAVQPLITRITAMPAPGERAHGVSTKGPLVDAIVRMGVGASLAAAAVAMDGAAAWLLYALGAILSVSGLGIVQVVLFHYCAHGAVFRSQKLNVLVGRAISIIFLFKYFDDYKREHIQHHRSQKLITEEDEFATFVVGVCGMRPGMSRRALWLKLALNLVSPVFHGKFLYLRLKGNLVSGHPSHGWRFAAFWAAFLGLAAATGMEAELALAWLLPLTVFLQIATVFRILCEHRIPEPELLQSRGKSLIVEATTGVFSGRPLPAESARTVRGFALWTLWWLDLLTLKALARLLVLVGDASCHDFHHRRPGVKNWPDAVYERAADKAKGCPGYPGNYIDVWGLMNAVDQNVRSLAAASPNLLGGSKTDPAPERAPAATPAVPAFAFATAAK